MEEGARANDNKSCCCCGGGVHVVSRRMVRPFTPPPPPAMANGTNNTINGFHHHHHHHPPPPPPPPPPTTTTTNGDTNGCSIHHHQQQPKEEEEEDDDAIAVVANNDDADEAVEVIHLTPWDLRLLSIDYIQKGILLPKPPPAMSSSDDLVNALQSSFAHALQIFYPFAGRLVATEHAADETVSVSLRCTGEGAEFMHAAAPAIFSADIVNSLYTPPLVWDLFPLALVLGADAAAAMDDGRRAHPVLAVQVTVLGDGAVFLAVALNHSVADGTSFWHFLNAWAEISRRSSFSSSDFSDELSTPPPVFERWFPPEIRAAVPIRMPFKKLDHIVRRFDRTPVNECFFTFSAASVKNLKARANAELSTTTAAAMAAGTPPPPTISSLQAVLGHLWRGVSRARRLPPEQSTSYSVVIGCRGRITGIPSSSYVGNAMVFGRAETTAGEVEKNGLGFTAALLHGAVAEFDEAAVREEAERWARGSPEFTYMDGLSSAGTALVTGSSPRFDVFGNDFGWGPPVAVRSGSGNKADGKATVFEGPERGGSVSIEVCIAPDALRRLVADEEFMDAVTMPPPPA